MTSLLRRTVPPALILAAVWWALTGPALRGVLTGALAVLVGVSLYLSLGGGRDRRLRLTGLLAFVPYFAWQSLRGGWDVSRRALTPAMLLNPTLLHHRLSLPPGPARVFFTNALSLMPGTVGADLGEHELVVHLLVGGPRNEARVKELEARVARLFGVSLS